VIHGGKSGRPLVTYEQALAGKPALDFSAKNVSKPEFIGRRELRDFPLDEIARYIDWTYFFSAWELRGKFPGVLEHPEYGAAARELYENGRALLANIIREKRIRANAVYGFWPAVSEGDDIVLYADEGQSKAAGRFSMLRQQQQQREGEPYLSLADFVAPAAAGVLDHVGAFALTAGLGADEVSRDFEKAHDDYNAIMVKALADRLAEAFAELLHERVRREWGYESVKLSNEALIDEKYRGIRPAFGYPSCPDHSEKVRLFELLSAESVGMKLTESCAMTPPASVSGIYLAHPAARYFNLGKIGRDQVTAYAARKGVSVGEAERWLRPNLGYDPGP
jgi:5-methyltetrahydrofolate--homocysteine methyltransferase